MAKHDNSQVSLGLRNHRPRSGEKAEEGKAVTATVHSLVGNGISGSSIVSERTSLLPGRRQLLFRLYFICSTSGCSCCLLVIDDQAIEASEIGVGCRVSKAALSTGR